MVESPELYVVGDGQFDKFTTRPDGTITQHDCVQSFGKGHAFGGGVALEESTATMRCHSLSGCRLWKCHRGAFEALALDVSPAEVIAELGMRRLLRRGLVHHPLFQHHNLDEVH